MGRIVVGVDASPEALGALRWGCRQAAAFDATLEAVTVYEGCGEPTDQLEAMEPHHQAARQEALHVLEDATRQLGSAADGVAIEPILLDDAPASGLLRQAVGAELLVVGSHGHGVFIGLLLGSVSQRCVRHAPCPVVVVPGEAHDDR